MLVYNFRRNSYSNIKHLPVTDSTNNNDKRRRKNYR
jgi:hypothetical protein